MPLANLQAPWRIEYIRSLEKATSGCFICDASAATTEEQLRERQVLWLSPHCIVMLNRYPYTNGHLLIAPRQHLGELDELSADQLNDMQAQSIRALKLLRKAMSPQGFNLGINLGRCRGAGLPGHVHQHIVPRWAGDTNFMHVIGETQVVPQALSQLYGELKTIVGQVS